jgi:hypothetical protein
MPVQQPLMKQLSLFESPPPAGTVSAWTTLSQMKQDEIVMALARLMARSPNVSSEPLETKPVEGGSDE